MRVKIRLIATRQKDNRLFYGYYWHTRQFLLLYFQILTSNTIESTTRIGVKTVPQSKIYITLHYEKGNRSKRYPLHRIFAPG